MRAAARWFATRRRAAFTVATMLELLDETGTDLSDAALRGAWRDGGRG